jgi:hypothetical protein
MCTRVHEEPHDHDRTLLLRNRAGYSKAREVIITMSLEPQPRNQQPRFDSFRVQGAPRHMHAAPDIGDQESDTDVMIVRQLTTRVLNGALLTSASTWR